MRTLGVDLAAEPVRTATALIEWGPARAAVRAVAVDVDDEQILAAARAADRVGLDCPLGWPVPFVDFVAAHRAGPVALPPGLAARDWRRRLAYRRTDEHVRAATGLIPLSVATDRIGVTALRAALLLGRLAAEGRPVDRAGAGPVVEVYPAASLKVWGLPHRGYKRAANAGALGAMVEALLAAAPWLQLGEFEALCRRSDHALDAVLASVTAWAALRGATAPPPPGDREAAATEGWIALPTCALADLAP